MDEKQKQSKRRAIGAIIALCAVVLVVAPSVLRAMRKKSESIKCGNQLVAITFAGRIYANDHDGKFPTNILSMSEEVGGMAQIFFCPADKFHSVVTDWSVFKPEDCSYVIVSPGMSEDAKDMVFLRCKVHGFTSYGDGTYFDGHTRRSKQHFGGQKR